MDTFYWFRDGQFGEVQAYNWPEAKAEIGNGKFFYDPTEDIRSCFGVIFDDGVVSVVPRWAMPKEFLVRLVLLGVGI